MAEVGQQPMEHHQAARLHLQRNRLLQRPRPLVIGVKRQRATVIAKPRPRLRLTVAPRKHPEAAVAAVCIVQRHPQPDHRRRVGPQEAASW